MNKVRIHKVYDSLIENVFLVGKKNARPPLTGPLKKYPQLILDLITEMWAADPDARPSMLDVVSQLSALMR